ncbi:hypothetical protein WMY93_009464 [Mugilogobius chulae]|uniref:Synaptonemal complex central element protein 3 n=1 Tax=Mugilogobius chulae TaxID=88201 RepID=A0AAW0PES0_9GOBI
MLPHSKINFHSVEILEQREQNRDRNQTSCSDFQLFNLYTMATSSTSSSPPESPQTTANTSDDHLQLNKDLEGMIEELENISVQLTCLAYDMVAVRTNPELVMSVQKLRDAYQKCKATILGEKLANSSEAVRSYRLCWSSG